MFLLDDTLIVSATDLGTASACEFALVRQLDALLGWVSPAPVDPDPMAARIRELGDHHEQRELLRLSAAHSGAVVSFPRPELTAQALRAANTATRITLASTAEVVCQAAFFDGTFLGFADFLERTQDGWLVTDSKLARTDSVSALLQVAAYADQLRAAGVPLAPVARLVLGSGRHTDHALSDLLPVHRVRRARLDQILAEHRLDGKAAAWGDPRWLACGRCPICEGEADAGRDVLLVAGVRMPQRRRLRDAGVVTIDDLATRREPVDTIRPAALERLRAQAQLQLAQESDPTGAVHAQITSPQALATLPPPSPGDIFFDFEGDPLWAERGSSDWGLEYLFGWVDVEEAPDGATLIATDEPAFRYRWANDRADEKVALIGFVNHLEDRRRRWPDLHVYHYAAYEKTALLRLAARHGVCEEEIDQFLREGVFVDLYTVVRSALLLGQRSYSIKKLEPLYMPGREIDLQSGSDSIVVHHEYVVASELGDRQTAQAKREEILTYNRDDCVSTLLLRNWLWAQLAALATTSDGGRGAAGGGTTDPGAVTPTAIPGAVTPTAIPEPALSDERRAAIDLEDRLRSLLEGVATHERRPEEQAVALVAAAVQFHAREDKPYWWRHFERLRVPAADWGSAEGVFVVHHADEQARTGEGPWHKSGGQRSQRRLLQLTGEALGGTPLAPGAKVAAVYADPPPPGVVTTPGHLQAKSPAGVTILQTRDLDVESGELLQEILIEELEPKGGGPHDHLPVGLVPNDLISTGTIDAALRELAIEVVTAWPKLPHRCGLDIAARRLPRQRDGRELPQPQEGPSGHTDAIVTALLGMDDSYVAVQGPPGTGKTYVGARVIAALVLEHGWAVAVCAQSHAAIENVLDAVVAAGVPAERVGKARRDAGEGAPGWTPLARAADIPAFVAEQSRGYVLGGTAWDLTNPSRVERGQFDLLVIDEAGQYSLAKTLAVSMCASRLLLLGDPQQLAQVSTGTHPDPVDASALGWLLGDDVVLPPQRGHFLETTWRMHPALTRPVSRLSYAGRLRSQESVTARRSLEGIEPGLHVVLVNHHDNRTWSTEEAAAVVSLVSDCLGRRWSCPDGADGLGTSRPLDQGDIIVVTPYNSQVRVVREALRQAGLDDVPVGTVDKFQGREAVVAIVSMAASAPSDVSRGLAFLLERNRLCVAISRGQHAAFLVRSTVLTDFAPRTPHELAALGAFIGLCDDAVSTVTIEAS